MTSPITSSGPDRDLVAAASIGDVRAARAALLDGASANATGELDPLENVTALMFAVRYGYSAVVKLLLQHGAKLERKTKCIIPDETSRETALHWAILQRNVNVCRMLVEGGADVKAESSRGSVLNYAIESGNVGIVRLLLNAGCSATSASGRDQSSPIHIAARVGHAPIIRLLHSLGATPVPQPLSGKTPLMLACLYGHTQAAKVLLQAGHDAHRRDKKGWTALMYAAHDGSENTVRLLLRHKADVTSRNDEGRSAWDLAKQLRNHAAAYWIEKAGGASDANELRLPGSRLVGNRDWLLE
jgi:ankyrin repeat protein